MEKNVHKWLIRAPRDKRNLLSIRLNYYYTVIFQDNWVCRWSLRACLLIWNLFNISFIRNYLFPIFYQWKIWCFFFLFFYVWKGPKTLTIVKVDYEQSLFYLSPSSETRKTRKWPRACRFSRLFTASPLDARARTPLTKSEEKERLLVGYRQRWITEVSQPLSS